MPFFNLAESPEIIGEAIATLFNQPRSTLRKKSGRTMLSADLAKEFGIRDAKGRYPPSLRQLRQVLSNSNGSWDAFVDFLKRKYQT